MIYRLLADTLVVLHLLFVIFVLTGGLLCLRWPHMAFLHLPAVAWGILVEVFGWICPLTPLEVHLRRLGGEAGYSGGFVEHYLHPILYPIGLTRGDQAIFAVLVAAVNLTVYGWLLWRWRRSRRHPA